MTYSKNSPMPFSYSENHFISFAAAAESTKNYRESMTEGQILGGCFDKSCIEALLSQSGCAGIRIYYGLSTDNKQQLILVGTDDLGNDLIGERYLCVDTCIPCPAQCGEDNILNS
jgi:hypothetical protein